MRTSISGVLTSAMYVLAAALLVSVGCDKAASPNTSPDASDALDTLFDSAPTDVTPEVTTDLGDSSDTAQDTDAVGIAPEPLPFPQDFLFGAATAGFQVEMGCPTIAPETCEDRNSDWYAYITSPETVGSTTTFMVGDAPSSGPGYFELYEQDFDRLANEVHGNAFRMSVEWSRIFPTATDAATNHAEMVALADPAALTYYHAQFAALAQRGLTPLVTLNHYSLPLWIHDGVACHSDFDTCTLRGWVDRERTVTEIAKYAAFAATEFGAEVDRWATLNEPFAVVFPGYIQPSADRSNPPALSMHSVEAKTVMVAMIEGHARMYDAVKTADTIDADGDGVAADVGLVYAMTPFAPKDPSRALDVQAADNLFYLWNTVFLDAAILGNLDGDLDGTTEYRADLDARMDWLGINYYTRATVGGLPISIFPDLSPLATFNPLELNMWEAYPRGLYDVVMHAHTRYALPIIISENGVAIEGDGQHAVGFLVGHLTSLARALRDGADVRGYFYWSLMDNYEWNHGMQMRFGLYEVDVADTAKTRTARPAAATYRAIIDAAAVPESLQAQFPTP